MIFCIVYIKIMPELPEVETVVIGLKSFLTGHKINKIESDWLKSLRIPRNQLDKLVLHSTIISLHRIGKIILIDLSSNNTLAIHLKLTGQLVYKQIANSKEIESYGAGHPNDSLLSKLPDKTTRVIFSLDKQAFLFFNDLRKFGWIKILPTSLINQADFISKLGPDALKVSDKEFVHRLSTRQKSIKACLLDQTIISGCGNIYADESLWLSKINPQIPAFKLKKEQLKNLREKLQYILNLSLKYGGSSSRNYVNATGEKGKYLDFVNVYQKLDFPCPRCKNNIKRIIVAGRGTYLCQFCQKDNL